VLSAARAGRKSGPGNTFFTEDTEGKGND